MSIFINQNPISESQNANCDNLYQILDFGKKESSPVHILKIQLVVGGGVSPTIVHSGQLRHLIDTTLAGGIYYGH